MHHQTSPGCQPMRPRQPIPIAGALVCALAAAIALIYAGCGRATISFAPLLGRRPTPPATTPAVTAAADKQTTVADEQTTVVETTATQAMTIE